MASTAALIELARPAQWIKNGFVLLPLFFAHALFDRLKVKPNVEGEVARSFDGYSVPFDGQSLAVGQEIQPVAGVTLTRKC